MDSLLRNRRKQGGRTDEIEGKVSCRMCTGLLLCVIIRGSQFMVVLMVQIICVNVEVALMAAFVWLQEKLYH